MFFSQRCHCTYFINRDKSVQQIHRREQCPVRTREARGKKPHPELTTRDATKEDTPPNTPWLLSFKRHHATRRTREFNPLQSSAGKTCLLVLASSSTMLISIGAEEATTAMTPSPQRSIPPALSFVIYSSQLHYLTMTIHLQSLSVVLELIKHDDMACHVGWGCVERKFWGLKCTLWKQE